MSEQDCGSPFSAILPLLLYSIMFLNTDIYQCFKVEYGRAVGGHCQSMNG